MSIDMEAMLAKIKDRQWALRQTRDFQYTDYDAVEHAAVRVSSSA